ncbi:MAG: response regulator [Candidatus Binatia bacterium]
MSVLLVEDEPLSRRQVARFIRNEGYLVQEAATGKAALDLINSNDFAVVITDLRLPDAVTGMDILNRFEQVSPRRGKILITAFGSDTIEMAARSLGALYISKPLDLEDLLLKIKSFLP